MKVHFDGEPDRFTRMRALFPTTDTRRVKWAEPDRRKFRLPMQKVEQWIAKWGRRTA